MEINSIKSLSPFTGNLTKSSNTKLNETTDVCDNSKKNIGMYSYPSGYYLNFTGARVDKDLNSFYARNLEYMPQTFKAYVESLDEEEKALTTPLEAQYKAFEYLDICDTPDDIKSIYPDEPLFSELKTID